jgi:hypothetical protein
MTLFRSLAAACALSLATSALAAEPAIRIEHPWSRPTPPSAPTAVGYLTIVNGTDRPDRLISVASPAADKVEVHSMSMTGGIMRMRPVEGGLAVPAHGSVALAPDGDHLMFIGLKRPFKAGEHIPVTLRFEHAGDRRTELDVEAEDGGMPGMPGMNMH